MRMTLVRALVLIVRPDRAWDQIATERTSFTRLLLGYVVPLAAVGPIATFGTLRLLGIHIAAHRVFRVAESVAIAGALQSFVAALGGVFLLAALIALLAPAFHARRDFADAFRIAAYAYTPMWIAGVFAGLLVPFAVPLVAVAAADALLSLVLGLIAIGGAPPRRAAIFAAAVVAATVASGFLIGVLAALIRGPV
ncbi:MAG: hypothetical protein NVS4B5_18110 [Vulcanimicrobiaceae bacterium]